MNYYDALQRSGDGRWDYTKTNDGRTWPVGYCAAKIGCECATVENGFTADPGCERCHGSGWVDNPEHCGGHDTAQKARECFARYQLDGWREEEYGNWAGCEALIDGEKCDAPTKRGLATRPPLGHGFALCDEHRTFEDLKALASHDAGQICASY